MSSNKTNWSSAAKVGLGELMASRPLPLKAAGSSVPALDPGGSREGSQAHGRTRFEPQSLPRLSHRRLLKQRKALMQGFSMGGTGLEPLTPSLSIVPRPLSPFLPGCQYFYVRRSERPQTAHFGPSRG